MECRQELSSNTTVSLEIFNETQVDLRIKENLDWQRQKGRVMTAEERILILRTSSNYAFAKRKKKKKCKCAAESLWLFTLRRYNRGLSRFAILILLLLSVKLHYICSFSSKRSITFYFRCHVGNLTVLTRSWMWVTHNYIQCVFKHWVTWTLNEFLPLESNF